MAEITLDIAWQGDRRGIAFVEALLEALPDGARLVFPSGQVIAQNAVMARWMDATSDRQLAESCLDRVRRDVIERLSEFCEDPRRVVSYERIPDALVAARPVGSERSVTKVPCILLTVRSESSSVLDAPSIATRFGLTTRQAQVAILLARGERNDTVAIALGISGSTARRHTEAVLARLSVKSRSEVAAVLSVRGDDGEAVA